jgi:hypothetical protein
MAAAVTYPHIVKPEGESARLERMPRIRVAQIAMDYLFQGWSADEICNQYPHLTPAEVYSALTYYFDHQDEIEREIEGEVKSLEEWQKNSAPSALRLRLRAQAFPASEP